MRKIGCLLLILFIAKSVSGQAYIVTYLKGAVFHDSKPVKLHDRLDGATQLSSSDKTAEIALFSLTKGKMRLTFANSKPVSASQATGHSELYQLVVADYLQGYNSQKALTTRNAVGLEGFFNYMDRKHPQNKVFLLEGEHLLVTGDIDKFFICTVKGADTLCTQVKIIQDSLVFDRQLSKAVSSGDKENPEPVTCFIKRGYTEDGKYREVYFSQPVQLTFLTTAYLKALIEPFAEGLTTYYGGDKSKLITDVEGQLTYYYGTYDEDGVHKVLAGLVR